MLSLRVFWRRSSRTLLSFFASLYLLFLYFQDLVDFTLVFFLSAGPVKEGSQRVCRLLCSNLLFWIQKGKKNELFLLKKSFLFLFSLISSRPWRFETWRFYFFFSGVYRNCLFATAALVPSVDFHSFFTLSFFSFGLDFELIGFGRGFCSKVVSIKQQQQLEEQTKEKERMTWRKEREIYINKKRGIMASNWGRRNEEVAGSIADESSSSLSFFYDTGVAGTQ